MRLLLADMHANTHHLATSLHCARMQPLARQVRCAAFNTTAALVAATQTDAKFYGIAMGAKDADRTELWRRLLDTAGLKVVFTVETRTGGGSSKLFRAKRAVQVSGGAAQHGARMCLWWYTLFPSLSHDHKRQGMHALGPVLCRVISGRDEAG